MTNPISCSYYRFTAHNIYNILEDLGASAPKIDSLVIDEFFERSMLDLKDQVLDYDTKWYLARYSKERLCQILKEEFERIGHLI